MENIKIPCYAATVMNILERNGFEANLVGGCVRDFIMGRQPHDWDAATDALPEQMIECFSEFPLVKSGMKHGTVGVVVDGECVEVTTYRVDGEYGDNRHPSNVSFTRSLEQDLARRDFTMNAMAYNPSAGLTDPFGGRKDIEKKTINCVGDPDKRFCEDGLRLLRILRFASQLGFEISEPAAKSIRKNRMLLRNISAERVYSDLIKLLCGEYAGKIIADYSDVLSVFLPEPDFISAAKLIDSMGRDKKDSIDKDVRLALLFDSVGAESASTALRQLKADNHTRVCVKKLLEMNSIEMRSVNIIADRRFIKRQLNTYTPELMMKTFALRRAKLLASELSAAQIDEAEEIMYDIINSGECWSLCMLAVNGRDLIEHGYRADSDLGVLLERLLYAEMDGLVPNEGEALLRYAETIASPHNQH